MIWFFEVRITPPVTDARILPNTTPIKVHLFQEDYALALEGFQLASLLDPEWPEPRNSMTALQDKLANIAKQVETKVCAQVCVCVCMRMCVRMWCVCARAHACACARFVSWQHFACALALTQCRVSFGPHGRVVAAEIRNTLTCARTHAFTDLLGCTRGESSPNTSRASFLSSRACPPPMARTLRKRA